VRGITQNIYCVTYSGFSGLVWSLPNVCSWALSGLIEMSAIWLLSVAKRTSSGDVDKRNL